MVTRSAAVLMVYAHGDLSGDRDVLAMARHMDWPTISPPEVV